MSEPLSPAVAVPQPAGRALAPWQAYVLAFTASACTLIIELVAGRIMAPIIGVSLYTWTSIIGVVLAGISLGNFIGGKLADRFASRRLLGILFLLSGLAALSVLYTASAFTANKPPSTLPLLLRIVGLTAAIFFLPSLILGTISPLLIKLTLRDLRRSGDVVGKIYAISTAGSIVGTFATGFYLVAQFGTRTIMLGVGLVCFLLAIFAGDWTLRARGWAGARLIQLVLLIASLGGSLWLANSGVLASDCLRETSYYCIKVQDLTANDEKVRALVLDHLIHSYNSIENPQRLTYGYEHIYAALTRYVADRRQDRPLRALSIGGGGYTFPRYIEAVYPNSVLDVIEIDPEVTRVAVEQLGLNPAGRIRSIHMDARLAFEEMPTGQTYDLILGDAFHGYAVPYHLTTKEFNDRIRDHLAPDGIYMLNIIDGRLGEFARSEARTLQATFAYVAAMPVVENYKDVGRNLWVLVGSQTPIDHDTYHAATLTAPRPDVTQHLWDGDRLADFMAAGRAVLITDEYAPVDNLLVPVFEEAGY